MQIVLRQPTEIRIGHHQNEQTKKPNKATTTSTNPFLKNSQSNFDEVSILEFELNKSRKNQDTLRLQNKEKEELLREAFKTLKLFARKIKNQKQTKIQLMNSQNSLREQLNELQNERHNDAHSHLHIKQLKHEITNLGNEKMKLVNLNQQKANLINKMKVNETESKKENSQLNSQLNKLTNSNLQLKKQYNSLKQKVDQEGQIKKQYFELKNNYLNLKDKFQNLFQQKDSKINYLNNQIKELSNQNLSNQELIQQLEDKNKQFENQNNKLLSKINKLENERKSNNNLNTNDYQMQNKINYNQKSHNSQTQRNNSKSKKAFKDNDDFIDIDNSDQTIFNRNQNIIRNNNKNRNNNYNYNNNWNNNRNNNNRNNNNRNNINRNNNNRNNNNRNNNRNNNNRNNNRNIKNINSPNKTIYNQIGNLIKNSEIKRKLNKKNKNIISKPKIIDPYTNSTFGFDFQKKIDFKKRNIFLNSFRLIVTEISDFKEIIKKDLHKLNKKFQFIQKQKLILLKKKKQKDQLLLQISEQRQLGNLLLNDLILVENEKKYKQICFQNKNSFSNITIKQFNEFENYLDIFKNIFKQEKTKKDLWLEKNIHLLNLCDEFEIEILMDQSSDSRPIQSNNNKHNKRRNDIQDIHFKENFSYDSIGNDANDDHYGISDDEDNEEEDFENFDDLLDEINTITNLRQNNSNQLFQQNKKSLATQPKNESNNLEHLYQNNLDVSVDVTNRTTGRSWNYDYGDHNVNRKLDFSRFVNQPNTSNNIFFGTKKNELGRDTERKRRIIYNNNNKTNKNFGSNDNGNLDILFQLSKELNDLEDDIGKWDEY
ncbi:hypothetical protein M0812_23547 [Anaeramoeba flamelloides]|uniref:Uncharacterized protein n=1 Tax=Anaeramoeba flamelloides TaxID=1746091 RepID=A0AAV7YL77_9EUKA|nr:hypothetical protein M0812_23547 [Anaeramoeba flamelloides]